MSYPAYSTAASYYRMKILYCFLWDVVPQCHPSAVIYTLLSIYTLRARFDIRRLYNVFRGVWFLHLQMETADFIQPVYINCSEIVSRFTESVDDCPQFHPVYSIMCTLSFILDCLVLFYQYLPSKCREISHGLVIFEWRHLVTKILPDHDSQ